MEEFWIIVALLPILILTTFFFGYEAAMYFGISLFGLSFKLLAESKKSKLFGTVVYIFGIAMYSLSLIYYLVSNQFFPANPFQFKFLTYITGTIVK